MPDTDEIIDRLLACRRIAVVGLSDDPSRVSYAIGQQLLAAGKEVIPVTPTYPLVMGLHAFSSLDRAPKGIELVNVFRRPEHCAEIARDAVAVGARGLWLQLGIVSREARETAEAAGMDYVEDRCIAVELARRSNRRG